MSKKGIVVIYLNYVKNIFLNINEKLKVIGVRESEDYSKDKYQIWRQKFLNKHRRVDGTINKWIEILLMFTPDIFHLEYRLLKDPELPIFWEKIGLLVSTFGAIVYLSIPYDATFFAPYVLLDDLIFSVLLNMFVFKIIRKKDAKFIERHWAGSMEIYNFVYEKARNLIKKVWDFKDDIEDQIKEGVLSDDNEAEENK